MKVWCVIITCSIECVMQGVLDPIYSSQDKAQASVDEWNRHHTEARVEEWEVL